MPVGEPLDLLSLARAAGDGAALVPGTGLSVRRFAGPRRERLAEAVWLLVLDGRLVIDLPHGDFRILDRGDALHLPASVEVSLRAVEGEALLLWHAAGADERGRRP